MRIRLPYIIYCIYTTIHYIYKLCIPRAWVTLLLLDHPPPKPTITFSARFQRVSDWVSAILRFCPNNTLFQYDPQRTVRNSTVRWVLSQTLDDFPHPEPKRGPKTEHPFTKRPIYLSTDQQTTGWGMLLGFGRVFVRQFWQHLVSRSS